MGNIYFLVNGNEMGLAACLTGIDNLPDNCRVLILYTSKTQNERKQEILALKTKYPDTHIETMMEGKRKSGALKSRFINEIESIASKDPEAKIYAVGTRMLMALSDVDVARDNGVIEIDSIEEYQHAHYEVQDNDRDDVVSNAGGEMVILIDYENVEDTGLVGSEYLAGEDEVILFYSKDAPNIEKGYIEDFKSKAKSFDIVKLQTTRKNGLDFYIAVRVGQILEKDPNTKVLIVSRDTGYNAVKEYCSAYTDMKNPVVIRNNIETGIAVLDGDTERSRLIQGSRQRVAIETEYAVYRAKQEMSEEIEKRLMGTGFEGELNNIISLIDHTKTPQERYLTTLKSFGRDRGRQIYQIIKEAV